VHKFRVLKNCNETTAETYMLTKFWLYYATVLQNYIIHTVTMDMNYSSTGVCCRFQHDPT